MAVERCDLDLAGLTVLTEAASGAYVVTPVLAAMAGADVVAVAAGNAYSSADEIQELTLRVAELAGVRGRIELVDRKEPAVVGAADIVTNSGQVRPIDADTVSCMKPSAVVPLMYESWEYREADLDLEACRARGILVAGTNERHPAVDVFSFLGQMAVLQLHEAGIPVRGQPAARALRQRLRVVHHATTSCAPGRRSGRRRSTPDTVPPAATPSCWPCSPGPSCARRGRRTVAGPARPRRGSLQYWGDADRDALTAAGCRSWPPWAPAAGHMGVLPSAVGPEPIVRLQSGGLKVGQVLASGLDVASPDDLAFVQVL